MKTMIFSIAVIAGISASATQADSWTWTPISSGSTLDAHLARLNFARPNPMTIFETISNLQEKMLAATAPRS